jgi:hypothetical protein
MEKCKKSGRRKPYVNLIPRSYSRSAPIELKIVLARFTAKTQAARSVFYPEQFFITLLNLLVKNRRACATQLC